jgi:hypothetical protein
MTESARKILAQAYEREMKQRIGDDLRKETYDSTLRAPLPSDWLKLIDSLRERLSRK